MARNRRRFQFTLRAAMLFVVLCAIPCSWLATRMHSVRKQHEAYAALRARGWGMLYEYQCDRESGGYHFAVNPSPPGPACLRAVLGEQFFADVMWVRSNGNVRETELKYLEQLPSCLNVELQSDGTDNALAYLRGMKQLDRLDLDGSQVSDKDVAHLEKLQFLRILYLSHTKISDAGLMHLASLPLDDLDLSETDVGNVGLERLRPLLPRLRNLDLSHTRITDVGLLEMRQATNMEDLTLIGTNITDSGLSSLTGLKHLTYLNLSETRVTKTGVKRLQRALPELSILVDEPSEEQAE